MAFHLYMTDVAIWGLITWATDQQLHISHKRNAGKSLQKKERQRNSGNLNRKRKTSRTMNRK